MKVLSQKQKGDKLMNKIKLYRATLLFNIGVLLTITAHMLATGDRKHLAIGGEILVIPLMYFFYKAGLYVSEILKGLFEEIKRYYEKKKQIEIWQEESKRFSIKRNI